MQALLNFTTSPWVGVLVLAVLVVEGVALAAYHARTGRGPSIRSLIGFLGAGSAFALALMAALSLQGKTGDSTVLDAACIGVPLGAAFIFHAFDLKSRW